MTILAEAPPPVNPPSKEQVTGFFAVLQEIGWRAVWVAVVIAACTLAALLLRYLIRRVVRRIVNGAKNRAKVTDTQALDRSPLAEMRLVQRTRTLGTILQNIVNVVLGIIAIVMIINIAVPSLLASLTLLTAAVGAGLGFGAQNIVKDVLNGIFIVAEDQVGIGDVVDLGPASGVVEFVSVRITQVRDAHGTLWYVRNGEIIRIGNTSQGWARAVIDLGVAPGSDIAEVEAAMRDTAESLAREPKWRSRVIGSPEVWGLESIDGEAIVIRLVINTRPQARDDVAQELRVRLKRALDEREVEIPSMASVTLEGLDGARRVRGANPPSTGPVTAPRPVERGFWRKKKNETTKPPAPEADRPRQGDGRAGDSAPERPPGAQGPERPEG